MKFFYTTSLIVLLGVLSRTSAAASGVLWLYALEQDEPAFAKEVGQPLRVVDLASVRAPEYRSGTHRVLAVRMGAGCARTAAVVAAALARFPCDRILTTGVAGTLDDAVARPGDWVQVAKVVAWQQGAWNPEGFARAAAAETRVDGGGGPAGEWLQFPAVGSASGEGFVASTAFRQDLLRDTGCAVVEMNLFGLHAALGDRKLPCLHLRVVSDRADDRAQDDFRAFARAYDGRGGRLAAAWVRALPADDKSPSAYPALRGLRDGEKAPAAAGQAGRP